MLRRCGRSVVVIARGWGRCSSPHHCPDLFVGAVHDSGASGLCMGMDEQPTPFDDIAAAGSPATPDALRGILARHQRTRTRTLGVLLAVALVAGPVAGWAVGHSGGGGQQVATASSPSTPNAGVPSAASAPAGG